MSEVPGKRIDPRSCPAAKEGASAEQFRSRDRIVLGRRGLRVAQHVLDLSVLAFAFWGAYLLRFDGAIPGGFLSQFLLLCPWVVGIEYALLRLHKATKNSWRFVSLREARAVLRTSLVASAVLLAFRFALPWMAPGSIAGAALTIPLGVIACNAVLMCVGAMGIRLLRRIQCEVLQERRHGQVLKLTTSTLMVGAGSAGHHLAKEIARRSDLGIKIVGFVDDNPVLKGRCVNEIEIYGGVDELQAIVDRTGATQALIAISSVRGAQIRRIKAACDACGVKAKIVPPIHDLVDGQVNVSQIRDVSIEDLLGRDPVDMRDFESAEALRDKVVMVTGAGGSIGSELCRQILKAGPATLLLVEQAEHSLYQIDRELQPRCGNAEVVPAIADVIDESRMRKLFEDFAPQTVFHAAAHKHVPMMEANPGEAIKNNALGTRTVAGLATEFGADQFVLISTDKAVNPSSVMGATKRLAELCLQALQKESSTRFVSVRFGNVLGSAGSVIPLFREQIAAGGPVTVTHPEMVRYFMTIPEACQLVMEAGAIGKGGEVFVLDMGEPVKILDLAEQMIRLSGFEPFQDIEIKFTGMRPGEKLFEELSFDHETMLTTRCPKIFLHKPNAERSVDAARILEGIQAALTNPEEVRARIQDLVVSYKPMVLQPAPPPQLEREVTGTEGWQPPLQRSAR